MSEVQLKQEDKDKPGGVSRRGFLATSALPTASMLSGNLSGIVTSSISDLKSLPISELLNTLSNFVDFVPLNFTEHRVIDLMFFYKEDHYQPELSSENYSSIVEIRKRGLSKSAIEKLKETGLLEALAKPKDSESLTEVFNALKKLNESCYVNRCALIDSLDEINRRAAEQKLSVSEFLSSESSGSSNKIANYAIRLSKNLSDPDIGAICRKHMLRIDDGEEISRFAEYIKHYQNGTLDVFARKLAEDSSRSYFSGSIEVTNNPELMRNYLSAAAGEDYQPIRNFGDIRWQSQELSSLLAKIPLEIHKYFLPSYGMTAYQFDLIEMPDFNISEVKLSRKFNYLEWRKESWFSKYSSWLSELNKHAKEIDPNCLCTDIKISNYYHQDHYYDLPRRVTILTSNKVLIKAIEAGIALNRKNTGLHEDF